MDSDWTAPVKEINGINLANYFPQKRSYNSVVFVHKKYLDEPKPDEVEEKKEKVKPNKEKRIKQENKQDKCQQFTSEVTTQVSKDMTFKMGHNNNSVLDQTIKFAKNIVPLVIPSEDKSNVFYTIKTTKGHRNIHKKPRESSPARFESVHETEEPKKIIETYRKVKKESISVRESVSHSSSNTLDDLNINQSLCCTFSDVSEKKYIKRDRSSCKRPKQEQKFGQEPKIVVSESFEAVATENATGDAKIKIHLMHDKDKHFLSNSIKEPVLNAIRDCILELNSNNIQNTEITTVQKFVKCNSQKLDDILDKLTCIENKLDNHETKLHTYNNKLDIQLNKLSDYDRKLHSHGNRLDSHEMKLDSQEAKLGSLEKKMDVREPKSDSDKKPEPRLEVKRVSPPKVQEIKSKSTLEDLGADLIEMDEEMSSEEELHQELLDRRSKSSVTVELGKDNSEERRKESVGGGEISHSTKGVNSTGVKLERPNRVPARFCWTDAGKKN